MKHPGSKSEFEQERNNELLKAYRQLLFECDYINHTTVFTLLVNKPSPRFWVTEERAAIVVGSMLRGDTLEGFNPNKREMFQEIYRRVVELKEKDSTLTINRATFIVVNQPAPKFYLSPGYAQLIILQEKKKCYEERKRKLQHLF